MQKWQHAKLAADASSPTLSVELKIYFPDGPLIKRPDHLDSREKLTNDELMKWFDEQIAKLGQEGWVMVSSQYDANHKFGALWFKRPVQDEKSKEESK